MRRVCSGGGVACVGNVRDFGGWITLLRWGNEDAVAADWNAGRARKRALISGLQLAGGGTPRVAAVLVVALFTDLDDAVAADRLLAHAGLPWRARTSGVHRQTVRRTTRTTLGLPLIALLARCRLHDPVSTRGEFLAGSRRAAPSGLGFAVRTAPIANCRWIAGFARLDAPIAAGVERRALLAWYALITRILCLAVSRAAWAALIGALITDFTGIHYAIATGETDDTRLTLGRAHVIGFDLAQPVAAVARKGVAVITLLAVLVDLAITATRWRLA